MDGKNRIESFVKELNSCMTINYITIQDIFDSEYGYPELDPIRDEICKCLICGLCQSAITLTNHLLEKSLKFCLILKQTKENREEDAKIEDVFVEAIGKNNNLTLENTINKSCTQGLITKQQKIELKRLKDTFRNPYSHSTTDIFRDLFVKGKTVTTSDLDNGLEKFLEICFDKTSDKEIPLKNLLPVQGIAQVEIARKDSLPYFKSVDSIIRNMLMNLKT